MDMRGQSTKPVVGYTTGLKVSVYTLYRPEPVRIMTWTPLLKPSQGMSFLRDIIITLCYDKCFIRHLIAVLNYRRPSVMVRDATEER